MNKRPFTLSSSGRLPILRSAEYISAEKHRGVSRLIDKLPSPISTVNHGGMFTYDSKKKKIKIRQDKEAIQIVYLSFVLGWGKMHE